jgi:hypothetical protein
MHSFGGFIEICCYAVAVVVVVAVGVKGKYLPITEGESKTFLQTEAKQLRVKWPSDRWRGGGTHTPLSTTHNISTHHAHRVLLLVAWIYRDMDLSR